MVYGQINYWKCFAAGRICWWLGQTIKPHAVSYFSMDTLHHFQKDLFLLQKRVFSFTSKTHTKAREHSSAEINRIPSPYLSSKLILLLLFHLISSVQRKERYCQHLMEKACLVFRATEYRERKEIIFEFSFLQGVEMPWLQC